MSTGGPLSPCSKGGVEARIQEASFCADLGCPGLNAFPPGQEMWRICEHLQLGLLEHADSLPTEARKLCDVFNGDAQTFAGPCRYSDIQKLIEKTCGGEGVGCLSATHVCGTRDGVSADCYQVPSSTRADLLKHAKDHKGPPYYESASECRASQCDLAHAWRLATSKGQAPRAPSARGHDSLADLDCYAPTGDSFICVARPGGAAWMEPDQTESKGGGAYALADTPAALPTQDAVGGRGGSATADRIDALAQQQRYELLGQQVATSLADTGWANSELAVDQAWGSPFSAQARLLGDGSALIARTPGPGDRLLSTTQLSAAQRVALAARDAPVVGALDWLQQGDPLGFVDTQNPVSSWSVGSDLAWRFPQAVLSAPDRPPTTLEETLKVLQGTPTTSHSSQAAHFCCQGRDRGCELKVVTNGTAGCQPVLGAEMLGAAEAKCELGCTGTLLEEMRPDALCFQHGDCRATRRWELGQKKPCYASLEVCQVASAQRNALLSVGSTYA